MIKPRSVMLRRRQVGFIFALVSACALAFPATPASFLASRANTPGAKTANVVNEAAAREADLGDLDPIVGKSEVVIFGEDSHFMTGLHSFAARMFRHLVEKKGFRVFVLESAWGVDEATQEFFKSERANLVPEEMFFLNAFSSKETIDLLRWIREYNRKNLADQIRVAGFQPEQPVTDFKALWEFASKSKNFAGADLKSKTAVCKASAGEFKTNIEFISFTSKLRRSGKPSYTAE
ncbi:MAG: erythromycin esterase family protein, partial [Pyrinomonadaceae bacterium]